jgi:hypothetical protein
MNQVEREKLRSVLQLPVTERNGWAERFLAAPAREDGFTVKLPAHGIAGVKVTLEG